VALKGFPEEERDQTWCIVVGKASIRSSATFRQSWEFDGGPD
jgi:hypothetical protein